MSSLSFPSMLVSIFVVVMSIGKALQMKFKFQLCARDLHEAKQQVRAELLEVRTLQTKAQHMTDITDLENKLEQMDNEVKAAINACPNYVKGIPPQKWLQAREAREHKVHAQRLEHLQRVSTVRESVWSSVQGPTWFHQPVTAKPGSRGSAGTSRQSSNLDISPMHCGSGHNAAPELDDVLDFDPPEHKKQFGFHLTRNTANSSTGNGGNTIDVLEQAYIETRLTQMFNIVETSMVIIQQKQKLWRGVAFIFTFLEIVLNAAILFLKSVPPTPGETTLVNLMASVNAVLKGIDLKLKLEVKEKDVTDAGKIMKRLSAAIDKVGTKLKNKQPGVSPELKTLEDDFQTLVTGKFESFLPGELFMRGMKGCFERAELPQEHQVQTAWRK